MKTQTNVAIPQRWEDIVFEGRNQSYGAYVLRKIYGVHLIIALIVTLLLIGLMVYGPAIAAMLKGDEVVEKAPPRKLVYTELMAPPPIDKPKPPPPQIQLPKLQKAIKFVPPKVVKEEVQDEIPTIEELKVNEVAAVEVDGDADVVFDEPVEEVIADNSDEIF